MNNDNTVKIGVALKWRNTFDTTKRYYQENVVTACGCVFRCKVLQAQGKSPIRFTDEQGHIAYTHTDIWDVLVDMAYYYNYTVDTRKLTKEMLDYAAKLDALFQKQQKEIEAIQADNKDQWKHIKDIEIHNIEQQRELNSLHDTFSCFSEGIWFDTLLWSDVTIWDNNKYAITDDLQNQINGLTEIHHQDIKDLTDKHDLEISALTAHIVQREKYQDGINDYLQDQVYDLNNGLSCFGSGVWENDLHWSHEALWDNNKYAITDALSEELQKLTTNHNQDVKNINAHLLATDRELAKEVAQNASDHRLVNNRLGSHDEEIEALQTLINEHDQQILDLIETLTCYSYGQWDDGLKWGDSDLWENSNQMCDTFDDIYRKIAAHQKSIDELTREIVEIELESPTAQIEALEQEVITENRKTAYQIRAIGREQTAQNIDIARLGEHFCCFSDGVWGDLFVWENDLKWANQAGVVVEALEDLQADTSDLRQKTEKANDDIKSNLSLIQSNAKQIESNRASIQNNSKEIQSIHHKIEETQTTHKEDVKALRNEALAEHRDVAYRFRAITREQAAQDESVAKIGEHFSCYADGVWGDLFVWDNDLKWSNQTGVVEEALEDLRSDVRKINQNIEDANEDIMTNLSLIRANHQLIEGNIEAIQENKEAIAEIRRNHQNDVDNLRTEVLTEHRQVAYQLRAIGREQTAQNEEIAKLGEHFGCFVDGQWGDLFLWNNDHLWHNQTGVIEEALTDIHLELDEIQENLANTMEEASEHFNCFGEGYWCNTSVWSEDCSWSNGTHELGELYNEHRTDVKKIQNQISDIDAVVKGHTAAIAKQEATHNQDLKTLRQEIGTRTKSVDESFVSLQTTQQSHKEIIDGHTERLDELWAGKCCFDEGEWNNAFFWNEMELWLNSPESLKEVEAEVIRQDSRLSALEAQFKLFLQQYAAQQTIIKRQQEQLDTLMDCFTVLNVGKWQNLLLWDNNSKWSNELITEAANTVGTGGSSTVAVKSYDSRTATVTI